MINLIAAEKFLKTNISKRRSDCKKNSMAFDIDIDYIISLLKKQKGLCALTGKEMEFTRGGDFGYCTNPNVCSIDRVDNTMGYLKSNVQLVCWKVNKIKGELNNNEFLHLCKTVVDTTSNVIGSNR